MLSSVKDQQFEVPEPPSDAISNIDWFPLVQDNQTLLGAASWDQTVRVWDVRFNNNTIQFAPKALVKHEAPVLACCFSRQYALFSAGCDKVVKMHNLATNQTQVVGKHDEPISAVKFDDEKNICITGSWDKTLKFWDCRQQNPVYTVNLGAKVYNMDYMNSFLAVVGSDRQIHTLSLLESQPIPKKVTLALKMQLRSVALMPNKSCMAVSSIEGRCNVIFLEDRLKSCHRIEERSQLKIFHLNSTQFHPTQHSVLLTAGADGTIGTWDVDQKARLYSSKTYPTPVSQAKFDPSGQLCALSLSYDWYRVRSNIVA